MNSAQNPEIYWLVIITVITGLMWLPYILQILSDRGVNEALTDSGGAVPTADWSTRAKKAHANAIENLVIFGLLALSVHVMDAGTQATATAAAAFVAVRIAHYVIYLAGWPYLRTIAFAGGVICQAVLALALLT